MTNGLIAQTNGASPSWFEIIFSGGIIGVAIMLVLLGLSMAAVYLVFDQVMSLRRREIVPSTLGDLVRQALLRGNAAEADAACRRMPSVLSYAMISGLSELDLGWKEVEKAVEEALAEQAARLMRRIEYLSLIGNIAPMVGLLGTVTGMIIAFQQVAVTAGAAGAGDLAEGIYQALVTTVAGLIVAIPSLGAFAICRNRVDELMAEATQRANHALAPIKRMNSQRRSERSAASAVLVPASPMASPVASPVAAPGAAPGAVPSSVRPQMSMEPRPPVEQRPSSEQKPS